MDLKNRILFIMPKDDVQRLRFDEGKNGILDVTVDVHGMKCVQVRKLLNNLLNVVRTVVRIIVIHGYNHSCEIKKMIAADFHHPHMASHFADSYNQGITYIYSI